MTTVRDATEEIQRVKQLYAYKKRKGTSAITGFLYRSHLLSLILVRKLNVSKQFILGCSVDDIGIMNEICFTFMHDHGNNSKSVAVFMKTKYAGHITDESLNDPKSAFNLHKFYQSYLLIRERFNNVHDDALFKGKFDNIVPYFIIYTPHQSKIKNQVAVSADDKIYTDKVNSIIRTSDESELFKVPSKGLVSDMINAKVKLIGKTIADYVTFDVQNQKNIQKEIKNVLIKYRNFLIPNVIKVNELDNNCYGVFNEALYKDNNANIKLLKQVLFEEVLKKSKVIDETASASIKLLLETNEYTADLLSTLIGTVIFFDENTKKLAYMPKVSNFIKQQSLDKIKVKKIIVDEAFAIAGMKALECIKLDFNVLDLKETILKQADHNELKNLESVFDDETQIAEQFLNNLYIYAKQGNENEVSNRIKEEICVRRASNKNATIFQSTPELVVVQFHIKVQKWMLLMDKPEYLTNSCDFLEEIPNVVNPLLCIHNYNCIINLQGHSIKFNDDSFKSLSSLDDIQSHTNIISNNVLLTSIKLMQYFWDKSYLFVNFEFVYNLNDIELDNLIQEVNQTTVKMLIIIIYGNKKYTTESVKLKQIINSFPENVAVVSKYQVEDLDTIYDNIKGLEDIHNVNEVLKYGITVQGKLFELGNIFDGENVNLIDAGILTKIIQNETIEIGRSLSDSFYNEIKDCFVYRTLSKYEHSHDDLYTLSHYEYFDLRPSALSFYEIVAIYAEPGMGKSTLITYHSVELKRTYPKTWIVKMNLRNYCEDFYNWIEEKTDVDIIESMRLVCRAELNHKAFDQLFDLEIGSEGDLVLLESKELDAIAALHLKLIINCFNSKNIIFLFDGFDEICPHYEKTAIQFIKTFVNRDIMSRNSESIDSSFSTAQKTSHNQLSTANEFTTNVFNNAYSEFPVYITSRPYNAIKKTLAKEFSIKPLYITQLSTDEQYHFYKQYWETRIKLHELNADQRQNVELFFEHMNQYRLNADVLQKSSAISNNMLLRRMHEAAVHYFWSKVNSEDNVDEKARNKWILPFQMLTADDSLDAFYDQKEKLQLTGVPLHMKILAELFVDQIKDTSSTKQWDMGVHTFQFYNLFLEIKLKKIRFKEKCDENIYTSAFSTEYENWLENATEEHKLLAFYAFFYNITGRFKRVLSEAQWDKIYLITERIKKAEEKTGLIDRIDAGVPRFVHLIFAEYYAVEYIADMLKMNPRTDNEVYRQIDFVVNCLLKSAVGIMKAFNQKLKNDIKLRDILNTNITKKCIFTVWLEQDDHNVENKSKESFFKKILENGLTEIAWLLLTSIKGTLNSANIEKFVDLIGSDFFKFAIKLKDKHDLIEYVLDNIRRVDPSMIVKALLNCGLQLGDHPDNEFILDQLRDSYPNTFIIPSPFKRFLGQRLYCVLQQDKNLN